MSIGLLHVAETTIDAIRGVELVMRAALDDDAMIHHQDEVGVANRREPVGDRKSTTATMLAE